MTRMGEIGGTLFVALVTPATQSSSNTVTKPLFSNMKDHSKNTVNVG